MKKNKFFGMFLISMLFLPISINAATSNTAVGSDLSFGECTSSKYQDKNISTNTNAYYSRCLRATCKNGKYNIEYYSNNKVNCLNGNSDPYFEVVKDGCTNYNNICSNEIKYCSRVLFYDCSKKSNGSQFKTTTTTKYVKPTTIRTTTTTTTTAVPIDSRLKNLSLSSGNLVFNPDVYEYSINIDYDVNSINVVADPMDSTSQVTVTGNTNLQTGSLIVISVKTTDDKVSTYKINITKNDKVILSNNTRLKSLIVDSYKELNFIPTINYYTVYIDESISSLNINYEVDDSKSSVVISGNENLVHGSRVVLTVTAEDGSTNDYYLDIMVQKKSNSLSILFIFIVVLALGAGGFYVYKKFFAGKSGEKYEYE